MVSKSTQTNRVRRRKVRTTGKRRKKEEQKRGTINYLTAKEIRAEDRS